MANFDPQATRIANLAQLSSMGFGVAPSLPLRGSDELHVRPRDEIVRRLASLEVLCIYVCAPPDKEPEAPIRRMIDTYRLSELMAQDEVDILSMPRHEANEAHEGMIGWRMENMVPLAWALGNQTPPRIDGEMIGGDELQHILRRFAPRESVAMELMLADAKLRPAPEILAMEDLFYCCHNAVRSAQFPERDAPQVGPEDFDPVVNGGVVHERRHALTWMCSPGLAWDDTDLST